MLALRVVLILAVGCAAERVDVGELAGRAVPAPAPAIVAAPEPPARAVDVTMAPGTPFTIRQVERLDRRGGGRTEPGAFDVAYTVRPHLGGPAQPDVRARVTCRVHDLALAVEPAPEELLRASGETRLTAYFRPDPFTAEPGDCEISFQYQGASVAKACLCGPRVFDGGCRDDRAPRPAVAGVEMREAELAVQDGVVSASAVLTVGAERTGHAARVRCEAGGRVAADREATPLPALDGLAPGTSRHVQLTAELAARIGGGRSRCEVAIAAGAEVLGRYCVSDRGAEAGACAPALGSPR